MVEGAKRQKTPNEIALDHPAGGADASCSCSSRSTLLPFSVYSVRASRRPAPPVTVTVLVALLVCLIPTTIGGLLSAIGIAGMGRMIQANVIATSGRAVEAAGDVDVLLLDKTGTITLGNRQATAFLPAPGVSERELADAAQLASLADETPEGRSIVVLAKEKFSLRERDIADAARDVRAVHRADAHERRRPRTAARRSRKGAADAIASTSRRTAAACRPSVLARGRRRRAPRQHAAGRGRRQRACSACRAQGHRQGRHQGALRRAAPHGHQDRDDHRRQPADRRRDRRRGRRRRLPRRGHARGEAQADPRVPGRGPPGRDDRRRHQRRARRWRRPTWRWR